MTLQELQVAVAKLCEDTKTIMESLAFLIEEQEKGGPGSGRKPGGGSSDKPSSDKKPKGEVQVSEYGVSYTSENGDTYFDMDESANDPEVLSQLDRMDKIPFKNDESNFDSQAVETLHSRLQKPNVNSKEIKDLIDSIEDYALNN